MIIGKTSIAEIRKENDVFIVRFFDNSDLNGKGIKELLEILENLAKGEKYKTLADTVDLRPGHISRSAYVTNADKNNAPNRVAEAFVVNNLPVRLLINFYLKNGNIPFPSEIFRKKEEAMAWLNTF